MRFLFLLIVVYSTVFSQNKETVSVQLAWKYQFQFAGYIMAKEKGFYERAGLDVELREYDDTSVNIQNEVLSGRADFGVGRASLLLNWLENQSDIKLLLSTFQSSPIVLFSKQREDIQKLADIQGKKVLPLGDLRDRGNMLPVLAMLASKGISKKDFELAEPSLNFSGIKQDKVDLIAGYISSEPFLLKEDNVKVKIFDPKKNGFDFYSDFLFTSGRLERTKPNTVNKFYEATIKGWQYAFANMEETVEILHKAYNTQNKSRAALMYEAKVLKSLAQKPNIPFGNIDPVVLRSMFNTLHLLKLTSSPIRGFNKLIYSPTPIEKLKLTQEEIDYIHDNPRVALGVELDWSPFSYLDTKGNYSGLASDYIKEISKLTGLQFDLEFGPWTHVYNKLKKEEVDLVANMFYSEKRAKIFNFSKPYYEVREYVFTREEVQAKSIADMIGKRVALQKDYETSNKLKELYGSKVDFIEFNTIDNAINALLTYKVDFLYNTTAVVQEALKKRAITNIKPAFQVFEEGRLLHFATSKKDPILANILSKTLLSIPEERLQTIANRWIKINNNDVNFDLTSLWKYILVVFIIILAIIYKNILLSKVNKRLQEKEALLEEQIKNNEKLLEENKRFIADTVHQIRTPLSVIMANSSMIDMHFNNEEISEYVALINGSINLLSNTYEDLAYMVSSGQVEYTPNKLNLSNCLKNRIDFFNTILHVEERNIVSHIDENIYFDINEIEYERLVDNNLTNALKYGYDNSDIYITLMQLDEQINLSVKTRSKEIEDTQKIFAQNYRENNSNRGLGLGLSITKVICDKYGISYKIQTKKDLNIFTYTFYIT